MEPSPTPREPPWTWPPMAALDLLAWPRPRTAVLAQLLPVLGVLVVLCGALWAIGAYADYKADLRRAETSRYLAEFRAPPVADAWQRLNAVLEAGERRQHVLLRRMTGLSGAALSEGLRNYRQFVLDTVEEHGLAGDIWTVQGFFTRFGVCIRVGNCDPTVARAQLGPAASRFRNQLHDFFALEGVVAEVDQAVSLIAPDQPRAGPLALN